MDQLNLVIDPNAPLEFNPDADTVDVFLDMDDFHKQFGFVQNPVAALPPADMWEFRRKFLREELEETEKAWEEGDLAGFADGLIDLIYVAVGTLWLSGFRALLMQTLWMEVHAANMSKVRAERPEQSKRGSTFDVVKPEGWMPPNVDGIIKAFNHDAIYGKITE